MHTNVFHRRLQQSISLSNSLYLRVPFSFSLLGNICFSRIHVDVMIHLSGSSQFEEKGRPLPKFGEWDVNDPASAEGFTVIFNKARDEKKTGGKPDSPTKLDTNTNTNHGMEHVKTQGKKWFCCMQSSSTNY
ncbi:protein NOI4-like isoform X1 [Primulina eburnea]|uniref:protein NOI4-like isoform X1 n=1 Tax=Primulina eburnea TaxID=1245227 RepID=UPI003C6C1AC4